MTSFLKWEKWETFVHVITMKASMKTEAFMLQKRPKSTIKVKVVHQSLQKLAYEE